MKNTSLKIATPVISRTGRTSTPGVSIGQMKYEMPWCFATSGSVRAIRMPNWLSCAPEFQIFEPLTIHSSPSRTARVPSDARSLPASGSLKSWHQISSAASSGKR